MIEIHGLVHRFGEAPETTEALRGIDLAVGEGYTLTMKDGAEVEVSRRQARELRERLAL